MKQLLEVLPSLVTALAALAGTWIAQYWAHRKDQERWEREHEVEQARLAEQRRREEHDRLRRAYHQALSDLAALARDPEKHASCWESAIRSATEVLTLTPGMDSETRDHLVHLLQSEVRLDGNPHNLFRIIFELFQADERLGAGPTRSDSS